MLRIGGSYDVRIDSLAGSAVCYLGPAIFLESRHSSTHHANSINDITWGQPDYRHLSEQDHVARMDRGHISH